MHKNLIESIDLCGSTAKAMLARVRLAKKLFSPLDLSEGADFNLFGSDIWVITRDRGDVEKILSCAPTGKHWQKASSTAYEGSLDYFCAIEGTIVKLIVQGDAVPPTCRVVEVQETIPAQPERVVTRRVLKCDVKPAEGYGSTEVKAEDLPAQIESI